MSILPLYGFRISALCIFLEQLPEAQGVDNLGQKHDLMARTHTCKERGVGTREGRVALPWLGPPYLPYTGRTGTQIRDNA